MSLQSGQPYRQPRVGLLPLAFIAAAFVSLVLGYLGMHLALKQRNIPAHPLDVLYYDLQLFVLGSEPLEGPGPYPAALEIARLTAPAVTVYAFVEAGRLLFATELARLKARRSREHTIVCGDGLVAQTVARRLVAAGRRVVTISTTEALHPPAARGRGPLLVLGDARDPDVLRAAGIERATALYACTRDSATNTAIALAAARTPVSASRPSLAIYARVTDPDLCLTLQARYLGQAEVPGVRLDFFNVDDLAARKLLADDPPRPIDGRPPRIAVLGATAFGRAVIVEVARRWRMHDTDGAMPLPLMLVDEDAEPALQEVGYRYPFLRHVCEVTTHRGELPASLPPPDRVFVCYDDEERALRTALTAERLWHGGPGSVVVRLDRLATLREAVDRRDEVFSVLHLFGPAHAASDPALIGDDLVERLARVIHDRYLLARRHAAATTDTAPTPGAAAPEQSLMTWDELPEPLRRANRAQAEDIGRKLRAIHCVLSPRIGPGDGYLLAEEEIQRLAVLEHHRWVAERISAGWQYAAVRDDRRQHHPALVDWSQLGAEMRERNLDAIRELSTILADAGFRIVRLPVAE